MTRESLTSSNFLQTSATGPRSVTNQSKSNTGTRDETSNLTVPRIRDKGLEAVNVAAPRVPLKYISTCPSKLALSAKIAC